jgi:hypothetical protein
LGDDLDISVEEIGPEYVRTSTKDSYEMKDKIRKAQRKTHDVKKIMGMVSNKLMLNPGTGQKMENKSPKKPRNFVEKIDIEPASPKKNPGYENLVKIRAISPTKLRKNFLRTNTVTPAKLPVWGTMRTMGTMSEFKVKSSGKKPTFIRKMTEPIDSGNSQILSRDGSLGENIELSGFGPIPQSAPLLLDLSQELNMPKVELILEESETLELQDDDSQ